MHEPAGIAGTPIDIGAGGGVVAAGGGGGKTLASSAGAILTLVALLPGNARGTAEGGKKAPAGRRA